MCFTSALQPLQGAGTDAQCVGRVGERQLRARAVGEVGLPGRPELTSDRPELIHADGGPWERISLVDDEAVEREREVGVVPATGDVVRIRVAQRLDFDLLAEPIVTIVSPPRITLGEMFELNGAQALAVAEHLRTAARMVAEVEAETGPRATF
ncbi:hypothetical protein KIH74_11185 [Kineosporia sp. J2-2]|uniref:Uncharacterized protein n=1 Tax=Kineosporia corallincola TaxID=2835133 RepID=A0ABS5TEJ7_9ACTN|nr:hypothetical protein [Kineosporia corallincola]MBT0769487.1 hypothetical protein [Kineosporia corallincola]